MTKTDLGKSPLASIRFGNMGLFTTELPWIHPRRIEVSYEIICPTVGTVLLTDGGKEIAVSPGELVILRPGILHYGTRKSNEPISFYWLHFYTDLKEIEGLPYLVSDFGQTVLLRELMHISNLSDVPDYLAQSIFRHLLALLLCHERLSGGDNRLVREVTEWLRINASASLTVSACAQHFGYNPEYLSRLLRTHLGKGMKALIDQLVCERVKNLLSNTNLSLKEIAGSLGFTDPSALNRFFKHHEQIPPSEFRKKYTSIHMCNH